MFFQTHGISECVINSKFTLYTDDVVLYASHPQKAVADRLLQEDLDRIGTSCNQHFMTINVTKSMCMYFGSKSKLSNIGDTAFLLNNVVLPTCIKQGSCLVTNCISYRGRH